MKTLTQVVLPIMRPSRDLSMASRSSPTIRDAALRKRRKTNQKRSKLTNLSFRGWPETPILLRSNSTSAARRVRGVQTTKRSSMGILTSGFKTITIKTFASPLSPAPYTCIGYGGTCRDPIGRMGGLSEGISRFGNAGNAGVADPSRRERPSELKSQVNFTSIAEKGQRHENLIPAASANGPQIGILRSKFEIKVGKTDPTVELKSSFAAKLPDSLRNVAGV